MNLEILKEKTKSKLNELGYDLFQFKMTHNKDGATLSIVIDSLNDDEISMDDIVSVSDKINQLFDELDLIDYEYVLDISSVGAEKEISIDKLAKYINKYLRVHLKNPIDGENIYFGELIEVNDNSITISYRQKTRLKKINIMIDNIYKINKAIKF